MTVILCVCVCDGRHSILDGEHKDNLLLFLFLDQFLETMISRGTFSVNPNHPHLLASSQSETTAQQQ